MNLIDGGPIWWWYFPISAAINVISSVFLGHLIFFKKPGEAINKHFGYLSFSVAFWSSGYFLWQMSGNDDSALVLSKVLMIGAIFTSLTYLHFVLVLLNKSEKNKWPLLFFYSLALLLVILNVFTDSLVFGVEQKSIFKYWPVPGKYFFIYLIIFFIQVIYASWLLLRKFQKGVGIIKTQSLILLIGLGLAFLGGSTNFLLWYDINIPPYGNILVSFYVLLVAYAIIRYRFLDINLAIRKWFYYLVLSGLIVGAYVGTWWFILNATSHSTLAVSVAICGSLLLGSFCFPYVEKFLQNNRLFFAGEYSHYQAINDIGQALSTTLDFTTLTDKSYLIFRQLLSLEKLAGYLIDDNGHKGKIISWQHQNFPPDFYHQVESIKENLFSYFDKYNQILISQELPYRLNDLPLDPRLTNFLRQNDIAAIVPIFSGHILVALFFFGPKNKHDAYSVQDVSVLETFAHQSRLAIQNLKAYQKLKNYSVDLQKEVDIQTKALRELNDKQSKLLADISHELQTPLAVVRGNLDLLARQGGDGQMISNAQNSVDSLSTLIGNILLLAKSDFNQLRLVKQPVNLSALLSELCEQTVIFAEGDNITYQCLAPAEPIIIWADVDKIKSAILNILSNAFKHTASGGQIKLGARVNDNVVVIDIFNSGSYIPEAEQQKIFDRFYRPNGQRSGTGLGLAIAKTIIEKHDGQISVQSFVDSGTTFSLKLPLHDRQ